MRTLLMAAAAVSTLGAQGRRCGRADGDWLSESGRTKVRRTLEVVGSGTG
jgi:hypothetical protein